MRASLPLGLLLVALLALGFAANANLAANDAGVSWDFESADSLEGWVPQVSADIVLAPGMGDSGSQGLAITIQALFSSPPSGVRHAVDIVPGGEYTMSGELVAKEAAIQWAELSVSLLNAEKQTIGFPSIGRSSSGRLSGPGAWSGAFTAGCDAVSGYLEVFVSGELDGTAYVDNLALKGPISTTPCPTATPSPSVTATASATPTATATATPALATATPIAAATATATPIAAATATVTAAPIATAVPTITASPIPPTNTPIAIPAELVNGGFESADDNGKPLAWRTQGGLLIQTGSPVYSGNWSGGFFSSTSNTKWIYQTLAVQPTAWYELQAQIYHDDPWVEAVLLRISWYASGDGSGSAVATVDSSSVLDLPGGRWRMLTTGPVQAPPGVHSAKVRILLRPVSEISALIYVDDVRFLTANAPALPTPTTVPPATATATPLPAAPPTPAATVVAPPPVATQPSATPTATAATLPASHTATPGPQPARTATPLPPAIGPSTELINGGFESMRDGRPLAWRTQGGNLLSNSVTVRSGSWAGGFLSSTSSTKWVFQTVTVQPASWYELSAYVYHDEPLVESVLLRVSWYASADGSGTALAAADSTELLQQPEPRWRSLSTGPMQAPAGAQSAKLRILLRPRTAANALIYVDDVSFQPAAPPPPQAEPAAQAPRAVGGRGADAAQSDVLAATDPSVPSPASDVPAYTPMPMPVIRRHSLLTPAEAPASDNADALWPWALVGTMLGVAAVGWGAYLAERSLHGRRENG